jgi:hypothetical protein
MPTAEGTNMPWAARREKLGGDVRDDRLARISFSPHFSRTAAPKKKWCRMVLVFENYPRPAGNNKKNFLSSNAERDSYLYMCIVFFFRWRYIRVRGLVWIFLAPDRCSSDSAPQVRHFLGINFSLSPEEYIGSRTFDTHR